MAEKYQQAFVREVMGKNAKGKSVRKGWQLVLKYKTENPAFVEKPEGVDTRKASEKRREVWKQVTKVSHARTKTAATKELQEWREEMEAKEQRSTMSEMHVPAYVSYYVGTRSVGEEGIQASTRDNYGYAARYIDCKQLDVPVADLTPDHVLEWVNATAKKGIGSSIRARSFSLLKYALEHAINMGHRQGPNPCAAVKAPMSHRRGANPLDEENLRHLNTTLDRLLEKRPDRRDFVDAVRLALLTGMRQGELCALRWQDVDGWRTGSFEVNGLIHVNCNIANAGKAKGGWYLKDCPKNGSRRSIPMNVDLVSLMRSRWQLMNMQCLESGATLTGGTFVLGKVGCKDGEGYFSPNYLGKQWRALMDVTDLVGEEGLVPHFHDCRHTALTHMLRIGVPAQTVAGIAGHQNAATTLRYYSKFLHADAEEAMQLMDGRMTQAEHQAPVAQFKAQSA